MNCSRRNVGVRSRAAAEMNRSTSGDERGTAPLKNWGTSGVDNRRLYSSRGGKKDERPKGGEEVFDAYPVGATWR